MAPSISALACARPTAAAPRYRASAPDAVTLLKADHEALAQLFRDFEWTHSRRDKRALVAEICTLLGVHLQIEEEIFYPAVQDSPAAAWLAPEAQGEHASLHRQLAALRAAAPEGAQADAVLDASVKRLSEDLKQHMKDEHFALFPKLRASSLDLIDLGARMGARRDDLLARAP